MNLRQGKQLGAYILVSFLAVGGAFLISMQFLGNLKAQEEQQMPMDPPPPDAQSGGTVPVPASPATDPNSVPKSAPDVNGPTTGETAPPAVDPGAPPAMNETFSPAPLNSGLAELEGFLEPFIYDVANRRDPFLAFAEYIPQEEGPTRALTPAQRFALEELRLVGVMWDVKDPKAMFMDPDSEVLVLGRDESIGNRNGYIAAIREGEVVVVEAIRKRGDIIYRTRVLRIER